MIIEKRNSSFEYAIEMKPEEALNLIACLTNLVKSVVLVGGISAGSFPAIERGEDHDYPKSLIFCVEEDK